MTFEKWRLTSPEVRDRVAHALQAVAGAVERQEANCAYRLDFAQGSERAIVRQFTNGTLTLQNVTPGPSRLFDDLRARIASFAGASPNGAAAAQRPTGPDAATLFSGAWIGTDEAGKGDYFGPLVSAAVFVDDRSAALLQELGVRDSKTLTDTRVRQLAVQVQHSTRTAVVRLQPERYNSLYDEFRREGKSLNTLLAWAHARAIEDLLREGAPGQQVLVDRFTDVEYIRARLLRETRTRSIELVALPRAEANVAVAAASILARAAFLQWLEHTSRELGLSLPKGASHAVVTAAREVVSRYGEARLGQLAKLHFKTTGSVLGRHS